MQIEQALKDLIRQTVNEALASGVENTPELVTLEEAAKFCGCGVDTVRDLFNEREANGFPGIVLGAKTHRVDKVRLRAWLNNGGLGATRSDGTTNVPFLFVTPPPFRRAG